MNSIRISIALAAVFVAACAAEAPPGASNSSQDATEKKSGSDDSSGGKSSAGAASGGNSASSGNAPSSGGGASGAGATSSAGAVGNCDDPAPPSLPQMTSQVLFADSSHPIPTASGGDEKGTWVVTRVTVFLPSTGSFLVDADASKAEGTAFVKFDGKRFLSVSDITQTISTRITGDVVTQTSSKVAGTYTYQDGSMNMTLECTETNADNAQAPKSTGFSRTSDTEGVLIQTADSQIGDVTLAMNLKKVS